MRHPEELKLERAKLRLILNKQPFFGVLFSHLKVVRVENDPRIKTMATDGRTLYYSPPFVEKMTEEETMFVCAHEVLHNAFEHHIRRKARDPRRWNIAADYVINLALSQAGVGKMPKDGYIDPAYEGMTTEEVYAQLPEGAGGGEGDDPGGCGGVLDACNQHDAAQIQELHEELQVRIRQAASYAKAAAAGNLPASLQRLIDELTEPKVDWADQLRKLVANSMTVVDPTWSRPNRRYIHAGFYLPGNLPNGVDHVVVVGDTSGSINDPILQAFGAEMRGILDEGRIAKITVVWADASVRHVEEFTPHDDFHLHPKGGGGTAFSDTFRWVAEHAEDAACVVYLTDLEVYDFGEEPHCPVIWAVWGEKRKFIENSAKVPFGDCVHIVPE